ncbi:hypothetical protein DL765_009462 [Monosporascus sp. GIB2]|nr:hypothetical protein DL765_009462 [Monosporascus sp. GIB2]
MDSDEEDQTPALTKEEILRRLDLVNQRINQLERDNAELTSTLQATRTLLEQVQQVPGRTTVQPVSNKEAGEVLKPPKPEPFDGTSTKLQLFLTQYRAYFGYFPVRLATPTARVEFAAGRLSGHAATWFEPAMREHVTIPLEQQNVEVVRVYSDYEVFEQALQKAFGVVDEKNKAEMSIQQLRQKGFASRYGTEFIQLSSKLNWGQEALMARFFDGLKKKVQEELFKKD